MNEHTYTSMIDFFLCSYKSIIVLFFFKCCLLHFFFLSNCLLFFFVLFFFFEINKQIKTKQKKNYQNDFAFNTLVVFCLKIFIFIFFEKKRKKERCLVKLLH